MENTNKICVNCEEEPVEDEGDDICGACDKELSD